MAIQTHQLHISIFFTVGEVIHLYAICVNRHSGEAKRRLKESQSVAQTVEFCLTIGVVVIECLTPSSTGDIVDINSVRPLNMLQIMVMATNQDINVMSHKDRDHLEGMK